MAIHQCPHCSYRSEKKTNVSRHCARKHDNSYLKSQFGCGVKEMNINHPSKANTIPRYHPRGAPTSTFNLMFLIFNIHQKHILVNNIIREHYHKLITMK